MKLTNSIISQTIAGLLSNAAIVEFIGLLDKQFHCGKRPDCPTTMPEILIYSTNFCPYCIMAKRLLDRKGAVYTEISVDSSPDLREEMTRKTRRRTVPQIYIGELHVGGFDELYALEKTGRLDGLLD